MKKPKIAFEAEFIIWDASGNEVSTINGVSTNNIVLEILWKTHKKFVEQSAIQKELDSCQVEIANSQACSSYREAEDEICELFHIVRSCIEQELWLHILDRTTPTQNYVPHTTQGIERYQGISEILTQNWARESTNITGIHMHIDTDAERHKKISHVFRELLSNWNFEELWISPERYEHTKNVIETLQRAKVFDKNNPFHNIEPILFDEEEIISQVVEGFDMYPYSKVTPIYSEDTFRFSDLLWEDGKPKDSYNLVSLKSPSPHILTTEIRTPDSAGTEEKICSQMKNIYTLVHDII